MRLSSNPETPWLTTAISSTIDTDQFSKKASFRSSITENAPGGRCAAPLKPPLGKKQLQQRQERASAKSTKQTTSAKRRKQRKQKQLIITSSPRPKDHQVLVVFERSVVDKFPTLASNESFEVTTMDDGTLVTTQTTSTSTTSSTRKYTKDDDDDDDEASTGTATLSLESSAPSETETTYAETIASVPTQLMDTSTTSDHHKPYGKLLHLLQTEVKDTIQDTSQSIHQVAHAFTLRENEIRAVRNEIQEFWFQLTHLLPTVS